MRRDSAVAALRLLTRAVSPSSAARAQGGAARKAGAR